MESENYCKTDANGPCRETALVAIRGRALSMIERGKEMTKEGEQFLALARQLEAIDKYADSQSNGGDGPVPTIGIGSDAEQALWRLATSLRM